MRSLGIAVILRIKSPVALTMFLLLLNGHSLRLSHSYNWSTGSPSSRLT
jgi:hypothetical protein